MNSGKAHSMAVDSGLERKRTTIDRILECAVTLNWQDLTKAQDNTPCGSNIEPPAALVGVPEAVVIFHARLLEVALRVLDVVKH
jgi:hypothetical protein